jgi:CheY-like chemotaxis protein
MGPSDAVYKRNRAQSREQVMRRGTSRRSAIVADRRPLERGLARFLLEERGLIVVGEAATMADVLLQVQQLRPDVIILHEKLALDHDPAVVAQIRRISPRTTVVLLASSREALPPDLILLADTVVEDGPGLTELGAAVAGPSGARPATAHAEAAGVQAPPIAWPAKHPRSRWADRLQGLAVASIIALAFVIARDMTTPSLVPTVVGSAHLVRAWDSLDELESALPEGSTEQIAEIASVLIEERAAAEAAGVNLTSFDQALRERLALFWPQLPLETQALLLALFGVIIDDSDILPLPSPTPPTETTTPPPTETTTPPPTETTTPPPTETQRGSLVLIPFAFTLMLAISGWARRRSHRSADGPD